MRRIELRLATASFLIAVATPTLASHIQTATLGPARSGGVRTDSAIPLEAGSWSLGANVEYTESDRLSEEDLLELRALDHEASLHSVNSVTSLAVDVSYGLSRNVTIGLHVPWVMRDDVIEAEHEHAEGASAPRPAAHLEGIEGLGDSSGLGDTSLYGLWRFHESAASDGNIGLIAGIEMPTGSDDEIADTGERFEAEFQPGTGSWDPFAGLAWSRSVGRFSLAASSVYTLVTEGSQDTDVGDQWTYNAGMGYPLGSGAGLRWNVVMELNGGWKDREEAHGIANGNSGGSWLFLSPGMTVRGQSWSVYASLGLPIDDELHGNQDQLDYRVFLGMQFFR